VTAAQHILAIVQHDLQLIFLLRRCLENHGYPSFSVARNRDEAILYLRGVGIYGNRFKYPLPAALILDAANKDPSDLEVLAWVREHSRSVELPVVYLCSEKHSSEHVSCMLDGSSFLVDRMNLEELVDALKMINTQSIEAIR
jgi:DNA-binding response OmpR family regulator